MEIDPKLKHILHKNFIKLKSFYFHFIFMKEFLEICAQYSKMHLFARQQVYKFISFLQSVRQIDRSLNNANYEEMPKLPKLHVTTL